MQINETQETHDEEPKLTKWQEELKKKQEHVTEEAKKLNVTVPKDIMFLWDQAYKLDKKHGEELYNEFIRRWEEFQKEVTNKPHHNGQHPNQPPHQPQPNQQPPQQHQNERQQYPNYNQNPYNQYNPNQYNQNYPNNQNYRNQNNYQNPNQYYNQPQYNDQPRYNNNPQYNQQPNQYNNYPQNNNMGGGYRNNNPVNQPTNNNGAWEHPAPTSEPVAGQQVNKWQQMLLNLQQEIIQWGQKNNVDVGSDIIQYWNLAMQKGDEDSYNNFIKMWSQIQQNPEKYKNSTAPWKIALVNQIEGQGVLSNMLGVKPATNLSELRTKTMNDDGNSVDKFVEEIMQGWNTLNAEISKRAKETKTQT